MSALEDTILSDEQRDIILQNLDRYPPRKCKVRLLFLPFTPESRIDKMLDSHVGGIRHVEIWFDAQGPVGAVSFSAYSGSFDPLPDDAGLWDRTKRYLESLVRTPPYMRGALLTERSFQNNNYKHYCFSINSELEAELFRVCNRFHGCDFNLSGYYRSILPRALQRTTTRDRFFCSEAVLVALQDSGVLDATTDESCEWLREANPGGVTPADLYNALRPYGIETLNQVRAGESFAATSNVPTHAFLASSMSEFE